MKHAILILAAGVAASASLPTHALESSAVSGKELSAPFEIRLETYQAAVQSAVNDVISKVRTCSAGGKLWSPGTAGVDTNDCFDVPSTKCFKAGKDYSPSSAGADAGGCIPKPSTQIPAGLVAAFNATSCPTSWSPLAAAQNRVIVGTGSSYALGANGGANTVTLAQAHLPAVSLDVYFSKWVQADDAAGSGKVLQANRNVQSSSSNGGLGKTAYSKTEKMGSGAAFDIRQPYLALLYCYKN